MTMKFLEFIVTEIMEPSTLVFSEGPGDFCEFCDQGWNL